MVEEGFEIEIEEERAVVVEDKTETVVVVGVSETTVEKLPLAIEETAMVEEGFEIEIEEERAMVVVDKTETVVAVVGVSEMTVEKLPLVISSHIFARLPADVISRFKLVSKPWRHMVSSIVDSFGFGHQHLQQPVHHHRGFLFLLGSTDTDTEGELGLYFAQPNHNNSSCKVNQICSPAWICSNSWKIVGSCHGLICLAKPMTNSSNFDPVLLYNPLLREYTYIPPLTTNNYTVPVVSLSKRTVAIGFGFHPTAENNFGYKYKVVRIVYDEVDVGHVETYTLGGQGHWESVGTTLHQLHSDSSPGVLVNGSLHWLTHLNPLAGFDQGSTIVSFDISTGVFTIIPLPTDGLQYAEDYLTDINEVGGLLCFIQNGADAAFMDLWIMREEEWDRKRVLLQFWIYSLFQPCHFRNNEQQVLVSCTTDGEDDFVQEHMNWYATHLADDESDLVVAVDSVANLMTKRGFRKSSVLPHINTFVSLKGLGEEDTNILAPQLDIPS